MSDQNGARTRQKQGGLKLQWHLGKPEVWLSPRWACYLFFPVFSPSEIPLLVISFPLWCRFKAFLMNHHRHLLNTFFSGLDRWSSTYSSMLLPEENLVHGLRIQRIQSYWHYHYRQPPTSPCHLSCGPSPRSDELFFLGSMVAVGSYNKDKRLLLQEIQVFPHRFSHISSILSLMKTRNARH